MAQMITRVSMRLPAAAVLEPAGHVVRYPAKGKAPEMVRCGPGSVVDTSQLPKPRLAKMMEKTFPALVDRSSEGLPADPPKTAVHTGGQKVDADPEAGLQDLEQKEAPRRRRRRK